MDVSRFKQFLDYEVFNNTLTVRYQLENDKAVYRKVVYIPALKVCPCCGEASAIVPVSILSAPGICIRCTVCGLRVTGSTAPTVLDIDSGVYRHSYTEVVKNTCEKWNRRKRFPFQRLKEIVL